MNPSKRPAENAKPATSELARYGWESDFPTFSASTPHVIRERLARFVLDASSEQMRAWSDSIPPLQREIDEVLIRNMLAREYSAILEYELPMESRRPDVILLVNAAVIVLELKGKPTASQADLDQASAYARDLQCYHRYCHDREIVPVVVPTRAHGYLEEVNGVHVIGPDALDELIAKVAAIHEGAIVARQDFLSADAYRPLPTLVEAARELFKSGSLRAIKRARSATDPAVEEITRIIHTAALTRSRHLVLVTGVPGAGKTLVGLRTVHAHYLDDLAVARSDGKPSAPAVFLSGNAPLVQVLQYELKKAGGDGKTFVRPVKQYVERYSRPGMIPPEHVLVFDEAQRAFDPEKMAETHGRADAKSEPAQLIEFTERIPQWCVVLGLIGSGQEIHVGEEAGVGQWRDAIVAGPKAAEWTVHGPAAMGSHFSELPIPFQPKQSLSLDTELRFHVANDVHAFVEDLLSNAPSNNLAAQAGALEDARFHLRITRSLEQAKQYLWDRYADDPDARFGIIASSKDKQLEDFGIPNSFQSTKRVKVGPWYSDDESAEGDHSCRLLETCMTEFGAQGLELDATLLAWGTDFIRTEGRWSNAYARGYRPGAKVRDPFQLRKNAYRVLLTRGRDACVIFVPPLYELNDTYQYLLSAGFKSLL